jgi:hypothetical protein
MELEWQENPSEQPMTWSEANEYVKSLGDGWKLPSIEELKEAYDNKIEGFKSDFYWSSEEYVQNTNYAWFVYFYNGFVNYYRKRTISYVRCVKEVVK